MSDTAADVADHPAKWSQAVLDRFDDIACGEAERLDARLRVLDPFAGVGRNRLAAALPVACVSTVVGIELQALWGQHDPFTVAGDALHLEAAEGSYDAIFTSPCYGNRMADNHQANDRCATCDGTGGGLDPDTDEWDPARTCRACKGSGLSRRNTYAHELRRQGSDVADGSAAILQWGRPYRLFHGEWLTEAFRVLVEAGLLVINMSNHYRDDPEEQPVVEWWINELIVRGARIVEVQRVRTPRQRNGANGDRRVDGEVIIVARTPATRRLL